jgi:hypothetical protein
MAQRWLARGLSGAEQAAALVRAAEAYAVLGCRFEADEARRAAVIGTEANPETDERMAT